MQFPKEFVVRSFYRALRIVFYVLLVTLAFSLKGAGPFFEFVTWPGIQAARVMPRTPTGDFFAITVGFVSIWLFWALVLTPLVLLVRRLGGHNSGHSRK